MRAEQILQDRIFEKEKEGKISIHWNSQLKEVFGDENLVGVTNVMLANPTFWFIWIFCVLTCMLTTLVPEAWQNMFQPRLWNIIMEQTFGYGQPVAVAKTGAV